MPLCLLILGLVDNYAVVISYSWYNYIVAQEFTSLVSRLSPP